MVLIFNCYDKLYKGKTTENIEEYQQKFNLKLT